MSTETHNDDWAWRQVEALADDGLDGEPLRRMQEALRREPELRRAVERARRVREALGGVRPQPVPHGLLRRLWSIPSAQPSAARRLHATALPPNGSTRRRWQPVAAVALSLALVAGLVLRGPGPAEPEAEPRDAAVRDFVIAMNYLQRGIAVANGEVQGQVGRGLLDAFAISRDTLLTERSTTEDGG